MEELDFNKKYWCVVEMVDFENMTRRYKKLKSLDKYRTPGIKKWYFNDEETCSTGLGFLNMKDLNTMYEKSFNSFVKEHCIYKVIGDSLWKCIL